MMRITAVMALVVAFSSCTIHLGGPPPGSPPGPQEPPDSPNEPQAPEETPAQGGLSDIRNNADITLGPGTYPSPGTISANSVTIRGAGTGATVITGDITVRGNNLTASEVLIEGSVFFYANNADMTGARITGSVANGGNNNRW